MKKAYNKPQRIEHAHSLDEFIDLGKSVNKYDYIKFAMIDSVNNVPFVICNVIDDYLDELKSLGLTAELTEDQVLLYRYNPKKLSFKLYETTLYHYLILRMNNMCSTHDFSLENRRLLLLQPNTLRTIISEIYNSEKTAIYRYNNSHSKIQSKQVVANDRLSGTI
jgi:hypothetical protein